MPGGCLEGTKGSIWSLTESFVMDVIYTEHQLYVRSDAFRCVCEEGKVAQWYLFV